MSTFNNKLYIKFLFPGGCLTLVLVISPILVAMLAEVYKCMVYEGCCGRNATDWIYLLIYPLFTVIMIALGSCHTACKREAMYLRSLEVLKLFIKFTTQSISCRDLSQPQDN